MMVSFEQREVPTKTKRRVDDGSTTSVTNQYESKMPPFTVANDDNVPSTSNYQSSTANSATAHRVPDEAAAIGIDLGTTYCCVGVFQRGKVEIIANDLGNKTTPSCVAFADDKILIGDPAKHQATRNVTNTVFDVKRLMGRKFNDVDVQADMNHWPFQVVSFGGEPKIAVECNGANKSYYPEEISSMLLRKMKETAETYLGNTVKDAVITVPAYFNDAQRQATKDAARIAKLNVLRIINEPTAAAIAYGLERKDSNERNVLIFDLGGGTFDVSVLNIKNKFFEVKSTAGDPHLGGEDFVARMVDHFAREFHQKHGVDLTKNKKSMSRLKTACDRAKRTLSSTISTTIDIEALHNGIDFYSKITRTSFEELNADLFQNILKPVKKAIRDARIDKTQIDDVVLIGGSSRIPKVQKLLQEFFNGKQLYKSINPDEAVAYGAAVQAALLSSDKSKEIQGLLLVDTIPLSLGIERSNETMRVIIPRNSSIPNRRSRIFTTSEENQTVVYISVLEGESIMSIDNDLLGEFILTGISPAPAGTARIEVTFDIDANGILNVSAVDLQTSNRNEITIMYNKRRLSDGEIHRIILENEEYKVKEEKEKTEKEKAEKERAGFAAMTALQLYCLNIKGSLEDGKIKDRMSQPDKIRIAEKCESTIDWLSSNLSLEEEKYLHKRKELEGIFDVVISIAKEPNKKNDKFREILNVKVGASKAEIQEGFKQAALTYHPDRYRGDKDIAKWWFEIVSSARDVLFELSERHLRRRPRTNMNCGMKNRIL